MKLNFADFLIETEISSENITKVIKTLEKRMEKYLGSKIYRCGGKTKIYDLGSEQMVQYFFDTDRSFQVRFKSGKITGIDIWSRFHIDTGPDYTIRLDKFSDESIFSVISSIADAIKHPAEGEFSAKTVMKESMLFEMATRVEPQAFHKMVLSTFGEEQSKNLSWDQIKQVADTNDVLIPAYIRNQKVGKGRWTSAPSEEAGAEKPVKKDPILYIKVTAQDPDTKRFIPTGESKQAQELYKQLSAGLSSAPTPAEVKDPDTLYGHMAQLVEMACRGTLRSLLIYGGPGSGKCLTGETQLEIIEK